MAKRKRKSRVVTSHCRLAPVKTGGSFDKVKIGNRYYRSKSGVVTIYPGNKTKVCPMGKGYKMPEAGGKLVPLFKVPKRR